MEQIDINDLSEKSKEENEEEKRARLLKEAEDRQTEVFRAMSHARACGYAASYW